MLVPVVSFCTGIILLFLAALVYLGLPIFKNISFLSDLKNNQDFIVGSTLISLALMLGVVGYTGSIDSSSLRLIRLIMGAGGTVLAISPILRKIKISENLTKKVLAIFPFISHIKIRASYIAIALTLVSISVLGSIFLISFFDGNYGGDAYMYHLPFAARLWGIISPEQYTLEYDLEHRLKGFPLLANFLQGFFWKVFQRPEATNLVCFSSLIIIIFYLKTYLKIPFYLATLSLLAVPMIHMHAARSYIDLPGNVGVSILILTTYLLYINKISFNNKTLLVIFLSAASAANIKFQLIPVVFIILCFVFPQIITKYWQPTGDAKTGFLRLLRVLFLCSLATLVIFATPIKNIALHQNPFYPVKVEIAGTVLNYNEVTPNFMHENIKKLPPTVRWVRSVLEINAFDKRRPWPWSLAMDFISWNEERFGMGGYFGGYVIFNLLLFIYLCWRKPSQETKMAIILMVIMTLLTSIMPQSYELRYYMYWMIVFVSLNTYLICENLEESSDKKIINPQIFGLVATGFMFVFITKTSYFFTKPQFSPLSKYAEANVQVESLSQIKDGDNVCLVGKVPHSFFYSSYFQPPRQYSLKAEFDISPEYVADKCKGRKIVR